MQPPQGSYPQGGYPSGSEQGGASPWDQPPALNQWVQRPIPGQQAGSQQMPGSVPPPAQIAPPPAQPYDYYPPQAPQPGGGYAPYGGYSQPEPEAPAPQQPSGPAGGGYQLPKTGMSPPRRRQRPWGLIATLAIVVLVGAYMVTRMLSGGQISYGTVKYGSLSAQYTGDAVLVRSETVDTQENVSQIEYMAQEGSLVKRGDLVATIYTSGFNAKEWVTLKNLRTQIKEYHKVLIAGASTDVTLLNLMSKAQSRAMEVQRLIHGASGSISAQEALLKEALQNQQTYIKQKNPDEQKLSRLYSDENTQLQRISTWTKQFAASSDGLVSFYTDGFERALNMTTYADYSPVQVRGMYNGQVPELETTVTARNATDVYRMVRQEPWVILMLCHEMDWTPIEGREYNLVIESFDNDVLHATVLDSARSGGELLVRLRVDDPAFLPNVLYLRQCQVRLGENVNSLMVPSRAIYVQNGRKGVVMYTEGGEYWTGVEVISDDGNTAYVIPDNAGVLGDGVRVRLF